MNEYKTIYNLVVYDNDLGKMKWKDALKACENLGNGWRLPTKEELTLLFENKEIVGNFGDRTYWSSTKNKALFGLLFSNAYYVNFKHGTCFDISQDEEYYVRPVKTK